MKLVHAEEDEGVTHVGDELLAMLKHEVDALLSAYKKKKARTMMLCCIVLFVRFAAGPQDMLAVSRSMFESIITCVSSMLLAEPSR